MRITPLGGSAFHLENPFADRETESDAFSQALVNFRQLLDTDADPGATRRNILTFHGVGGIGKTTLSRRLQSWVTGGLEKTDLWGAPPRTAIATTARIDLH